MKSVFGSLVAIAGLAVSAAAQTRFDLQVSTDGTVWSDSASVNKPVGESSIVLVRALVSYTGTATPFGFASLTWQPVIRNARPGLDVVMPFADQGNNTNGGGVDLGADPFSGPFGRVRPFAATGPTLGSTFRYISHSNLSGTNGVPGDIPAANAYMRIARNDITAWTGTGPTTGTWAVNNFNGAGGIACVQKSAAQVTPNDPPFNGSTQNVVIFQMSMSVAGVASSHRIDLLAPLNGMSLNTTNNRREAFWFESATDNYGAIKGAVNVDPASITVTPAPGALGLLGLAGLFAARRRR